MVAFTILQSSTEIPDVIQDSRVAHPTHLGFLPLYKLELIVHGATNVMMAVMDGRTAKFLFIVFIYFVESLEYSSVISLFV